ncbi:phospholipid-binding protein MlaC [Magnetospira sp. QH-2]|uniref:MlaC/ttg2D family ABC transporter substrate-binding protein n=1 Tax=Magnetospira sp. (strain QH-2) TaxID=1288970 RepID=UPI0003E81A85|nr:ABC transporter substrate-binding protein [Magnetospira sp. QH-2]CCQ72532.1 Putative toluene tolerance protein [Magnetospira sp. QH-2]
MLKRFAVAAVAVLTLAQATSADAQSYGPRGPYGQQAPSGPYAGKYPGTFAPRVMPQRMQRGPQRPARAETETIVEAGIGKLRTFVMQNRKADKTAMLGFVTTEIAPYFDFDHMTKWALGKRSSALSDAERAKAAGWLSQHFLETLVRHMGVYNGARTRVQRAYEGRDGRATTSTVPVSVESRGGDNTNLEFRFYKGKDGWKVYDVKANGQSALMFYRRMLNDRVGNQQRQGQRRMPPRQYMNR